MEAGVRAIAHPDLALVRREADAVTRTAVAFHGAFLESGHLDALQQLAGLEITDLEPQQVVDVHVAATLGAVDRERSNDTTERADEARHAARFRVGDAQLRGAEP